jgi:DHA1 family inner membrane transport protein
VSLLFGATPFLIPLVAERYGVSVGTAGLISAVQVSGFAVTTFVAGRWWSPSRRKLVLGGVIGLVFNGLSAIAGSFELLLGFRLMAGTAAGVFTWLAWADAMRDRKSMRTIAAVGPVTVLVGAPILAWIGSAAGTGGLYWTLAVSLAPVLVLRPDFGGSTRHRRRSMSPSRSNVVLLIALGTLTMAGSGLFVFVGAFATTEIGMGVVAVAVGFSVNAAAGLVGARWKARPQHAWPWMGVITLSASMLVVAPSELVYFLAMVGWGFAFWMAIPTVLTAIAEWSLVPEERVGDAQSIMAAGRAFGPVIGGVLVGSGAYGRLGIFTGIGLGAAAVLVGSVERYRRGREAPLAD